MKRGRMWVRDEGRPVRNANGAASCSPASRTSCLLSSVAVFVHAAGVKGANPVELLSHAMERAGLPCSVMALLNDTVGVLAAQR